MEHRQGFSSEAMVLISCSLNVIMKNGEVTPGSAEQGQGDVRFFSPSARSSQHPGLAEIQDARRLEANRANPVTSQWLIQFVRQGGEAKSSSMREWSLLSPRGEGNMRGDLDHQLKFPQEITTTSLWPEIMLWSTSTRTVIMAELTVQREEGREAAFKRKKEKYTELEAVCSQAGWRVFTNPVEVGCRGYTGTSSQWFLKSLEITGSKLRQNKGASGFGSVERTSTPTPTSSTEFGGPQLLSRCVKELEECVLSGLCVLDEAGPGSALKTLFSLSAGEVPGSAVGWWVPSEGNGVRVCVWVCALRAVGVGGGKPSLVAPTVVRRALT
eukprot:superscaffoldBa00000022_g439